eukprot:Sspe_Gene.54292::Locus_29968_Transcript_1_3_Confidence_0.400_Length_950::g.54292::m.54292
MTDNLSEAIVGQHIRFRVNNAESVEGVVYAYDPQQNTLAVFDMNTSQRARHNFRIFNTLYISQVSIVGDADDYLPEALRRKSPALPKLHTDKLKDRLQNAKETRPQYMGRDVTIEAQDVFDSINRTLKCKWEGTNIIILGSVRLTAPYTPNELQEVEGSGGRGQQTLEHVTKILIDRQKKMQK